MLYSGQTQSLRCLMKDHTGFDVPDMDIDAMTCDSRLVTPRSIYCAVTASGIDGRDYVDDAIARGAGAIVAQRGPTVQQYQVLNGTPIIGLQNSREEISEIAASFFQKPSASLQVAAVTGTNGKTTLCYWLGSLLQRAGLKTAQIGTLGVGSFAQEWQQWENTGFTTPDPVGTQYWLSCLLANGHQNTVMEISSHALEQGRAAAVEIDIAIFTNLSQDHLDYHGSMQNYANAKAKLFEFKSLSNAVINKDDGLADKLLSICKKQGVESITYGLTNNADIYPSRLIYKASGMQVQLVSPWGAHEFFLPALAQFNVYNAMAVFASAALMGVNIQQLETLMSQLPQVPGRMEAVNSPSNSCIGYVDYAHTPDAVSSVVKELSQLAKRRNGVLRVVLGCGGDRDVTKRPLMAAAVTTAGAYLMITSDNPRSELVEDIAEHMLSGVSPSAMAEQLVTINVDREAAIESVVEISNDADVIAVLGKGHENFQLIGKDKIPFNDVAVLTAKLAAKVSTPAKQEMNS